MKFLHTYKFELILHWFCVTIGSAYELKLDVRSNTVYTSYSFIQKYNVTQLFSAVKRRIMGRKKRDKIEFRFYELPQGESVLGLMGNRWVGNYGHKDRAKELHFHNLFELGCCRQGSGSMILGEKQTQYHANMVSMIPANYPHNTVSDEVSYWEYLFFDPTQLICDLFPNNARIQAEKLAAINQRADLLLAENCSVLAGIADRILDELRDRRPYYRECVNYLIRTLVLELLRLQEGKESESQWEVNPDSALLTQITPALRYIEENYREPIRAAHLARECGLSEVHFRRIFEDYMNMAPMDYVNLVRIQKACDLMSREDSSMDVIALECGFASVSTYTRNFKKILKTTPYQWKLKKDNYRSSLLSYNISALKGWTGLDSL